MRDRDAPPRLRQRACEKPCVVTVRAAFQAMEQHCQMRELLAAGEIDVDEVAVRRLPAAAPEGDALRREQRRAGGFGGTDQCRGLGWGARGGGGARGWAGG